MCPVFMRRSSVCLTINNLWRALAESYYDWWSTWFLRNKTTQLWKPPSSVCWPLWCLSTQLYLQIEQLLAKRGKCHSTVTFSRLAECFTRNSQNVFIYMCVCDFVLMSTGSDRMVEVDLSLSGCCFGQLVIVWRTVHPWCYHDSAIYYMNACANNSIRLN